MCVASVPPPKKRLPPSLSPIPSILLPRLVGDVRQKTLEPDSSQSTRPPLIGKKDTGPKHRSKSIIQDDDSPEEEEDIGIKALNIRGRVCKVSSRGQKINRWLTIYKSLIQYKNP